MEQTVQVPVARLSPSAQAQIAGQPDQEEKDQIRACVRHAQGEEVGALLQEEVPQAEVLSVMTILYI